MTTRKKFWLKVLIIGGGFLFLVGLIISIVNPELLEKDDDGNYSSLSDNKSEGSADTESTGNSYKSNEQNTTANNSFDLDEKQYAYSQALENSWLETGIDIECFGGDNMLTISTKKLPESVRKSSAFQIYNEFKDDTQFKNNLKAVQFEKIYVRYGSAFLGEHYEIELK